MSHLIIIKINFLIKFPKNHLLTQPGRMIYIKLIRINHTFCYFNKLKISF